MTKVVNKRNSKYDIYIGRPSIWGNPFSHLNGTLAKYKAASRQDAINKYENYLRNNKELMSRLPELKGKILGCWCKPLECHGDVLVRLVEYYYGNKTIWDYCNENDLL